MLLGEERMSLPGLDVRLGCSLSLLHGVEATPQEALEWKEKEEGERGGVKRAGTGRNREREREKEVLVSKYYCLVYKVSERIFFANYRFFITHREYTYTRQKEYKKIINKMKNVELDFFRPSFPKK